MFHLEHLAYGTFELQPPFVVDHKKTFCDVIINYTK
jgi:hypothetical protein